MERAQLRLQTAYALLTGRQLGCVLAGFECQPFAQDGRGTNPGDPIPDKCDNAHSVTAANDPGQPRLAGPDNQMKPRQ